MRTRWKITSAVVMALGLLWVVLQGYSFSWTGFGDYTAPNGEYVRGKTLWDWMELLIIPLVLAIGAFVLNRSERDLERQRAEHQARLDHQRADQRANLEREIAADRQQENELQVYLDRIANLFLHENLILRGNEKVHTIARILTLTVLRGLSATRKGIVLRFLYDAKLIDKGKEIIDLAYADLKGAVLNNAFLNGASLRGADLRDATLRRADLVDSNLTATDLRGANLRYAILENVILDQALLDGADLTGAVLNGAEIDYVILDPQSDDYSGTILDYGAAAYVTPEGVSILASLQLSDAGKEQLATAKSLKGAIMPDGTRHA